jgi:hypothetical protein
VKRDIDLSHEQAKIISQKLYKKPGEQKAYEAGFNEAASRADEVVMDVLTHHSKREHELLMALVGRITQKAEETK